MKDTVQRTMSKLETYAGWCDYHPDYAPLGLAECIRETCGLMKLLYEQREYLNREIRELQGEFE